MSQAELAALERDVEQARARFARDLARLGAPGTVSSFKDQLYSEAMDAKDEWVEKGKQAAQDTAQRVFNDLKGRALANPAAALAIGAGLGWRLARHPPITSLLLGLGLFGLFRTSPQRSSGMSGNGGNAAWRRYRREIGSRASALSESVGQKAQEWSFDTREAAKGAMTQVRDRAAEMAERASETARDTATQVADQAAMMAERASETARDTAAQVADRAAVMADKATAMASRASTAVYEALPDRETRDKLLLGTAALAVAAAIGIAYQRRDQEHVQ